MLDFDGLIEMLASPSPSVRRDACEWLRAAPSLPPSAIAPLERATNDPNPLVADAATRALQAHETPQNPALQAPPTTVRSGPRLSLALLGAAAMALVVLLCGLFLMLRESSTLGFSWRSLLFLYTAPFRLIDVAPGFLLFGLAYLIPFIVAFTLPANTDRTSATHRVILSGCAAGLFYFVGFCLTSLYFG